VRIEKEGTRVSSKCDVEGRITAQKSGVYDSLLNALGAWGKKRRGTSTREGVNSEKATTRSKNAFGVCVLFKPVGKNTL